MGRKGELVQMEAQVPARGKNQKWLRQNLKQRAQSKQQWHIPATTRDTFWPPNRSGWSLCTEITFHHFSKDCGHGWSWNQTHQKLSILWNIMLSQQISQYKTLPTKQGGRPRLDASYCNRVGRKASNTRKVDSIYQYVQVVVPMHDTNNTGKQPLRVLCTTKSSMTLCVRTPNRHKSGGINHYWNV